MEEIPGAGGLLELDFFIRHVLASDRVVFLERQLVGRIFLVFESRVEMSRTSGGFQFDFFTHDDFLSAELDGLTLSAKVCQNGVDAFFVDGAQTRSGQTKRHITFFAFDPDAAVLKIRKKTALGFIVRVGNGVPDHRGFSSDLANSCHDVGSLKIGLRPQGRDGIADYARI
jgi:hypothetical protein